MKFRHCTFLLIAVLLACGEDANSAETSDLRKIRAAITSISGSMVPPWAAHEAASSKNTVCKSR